VRVLVAGWFSFVNGHATAGDLLARDVACTWLRDFGVAFDIAVAPPFTDGVYLDHLSASEYSHLLFVCGPFGDGELEQEILGRFGELRRIGLNLSMAEPLEAYNPWDLLFERDSSRTARPDIVFLSSQARVPVVGVCLVEEYPGALVPQANRVIGELLDSREMSVVRIDTRLDVNQGGLRSPAEIESLMARMDAIVTTRLHGAVLALKNGVPAVVVNPEARGTKLRRQAEVIDWPFIFDVESVTADELRSALDYCLSDAARAEANACRERALSLVSPLRAEFLAALESERNLSSLPPTSRRGQSNVARRGAEFGRKGPDSSTGAGHCGDLATRIRGGFRNLLTRIAP
jgi:hypothetical protein